MNLTEEQKKQVAAWAAEGMSLSQIQQKIGEEFDLKLTYMDTRFLIDDLEVTLAENRPSQPADEVIKDAGVGGAASPDGVSVELDRITQPGAIASGSVTFSDGKHSTWALDQQGRLLLEAASQGYRPSKEDLEAFQQELSTALERSGM